MTAVLTPDLPTITTFFGAVWPDTADLPERASFVLWTLAPGGAKRTTWVPVADRDRLPEVAAELARGMVNVYIGAALQRQDAAIEAAWAKRREKDGPDAPRPEPANVRGPSETTVALCGLFVDLDVKGPAHAAEDLPASFDEAHEFVRALPLAPGLVISTGHGLQAWWPFREPLVFEADAERAAAQSLSRRWRGYVSRLARERGWTLDPTDDLARVMRVPGTFNVKLGVKGAPLARIAEYVSGRRFNPSDFELYLPAEDPVAATTKVSPSGEYRPVPVGPILAGCAWLRHTRDDAPTLPEPEWYAMLSIVGRCVDGGELAHEWSKPHRGYRPEETGAKLARALAVGPVTCSKVASVTAGKWCDECPSKARGIRSPINLATPRRKATPAPVPETSSPTTEADDGGAPTNGNGTMPLPALRPLTETGNAERLMDRYGRDVHWSAALGWLVWDGRRWVRDDRRRVYALAKLTVRGIYGEAQACDDDKLREAIAAWAKTSERSGAREAMVSLVRSEPGVAVGIEDLDTDPWALNVLNGTLDLRTGELRRHDRRDLLTRLAPVEYLPDATASTWLEFLERVLPDPDVRAFLRRFIGYSMTGVVREHVLPVLYGTGSNGKSTFLEAVRTAMGDYAVQANPALLMAKTSETHPTDRATLLGRRLAVCSETEEGRALAEVMVKQLTGGDTINARYMRMDEFNFVPTHKLVMCTNHKPRVRGTDLGIWRRVKLVPFTVTIPEPAQDATLPEKLRAEGAGILRWCVEGCAEWQRTGLKPPAAVEAATAEYRLEEDTIGQFLADRCHLAPGADPPRMKASDLYAAFKVWCEETGTPEVNQRTFGSAMTERGTHRTDVKGLRWYTGIRLLLPSELRTEDATKLPVPPAGGPETGVL